MSLYIKEFSRYVIVAFLFFYTLEGFLTLFYRSESKRKPLYIFQIINIIVVQISLFIQIEAQTKDPKELFFFAFQIIILLAVITIFYTLYPDGNRLIINNMCMLLMISLAVLTRLSAAKAVRQFIIATASLIIFFFIPMIIFRFNKLRDLGWVCCIVSIASLLVVLIFGAVTNGSKLSFTIAGLTFQPSEAVKILFAIFLASTLSKSKDLMNLLYISLASGGMVLILVFSKDLGSALIFFIIFTFTVFIATKNWGYLLLNIGMGVIASLVAYRLFSHVRNRVIAWRDPFDRIESTGYQLAQSLFGISSGGLFGMGLYGGNPESIPFVEDDFIFSAIAEELGLLFAIFLILICLSTFLMIMLEAYHVRNEFYRLLSCALGITYIFQVFLTIGGGTKFIPLTGVTLPLVSYGGTSVLTTIVMFGIVEGVSMIRYEEHQVMLDKMRARMESSQDERATYKQS